MNANEVEVFQATDRIVLDLSNRRGNPGISRYDVDWLAGSNRSPVDLSDTETDVYVGQNEGRKGGETALGYGLDLTSKS
jgi:hypothetical protein